MPTITFLPENKQIEVPSGTNLMAAIIEAGLPIGSSCGAVGICARCFVEVVEGLGNLNPPNPVEKKLLLRENLGPQIRISCQTKVLGNLTIKTSYW